MVQTFMPYLYEMESEVFSTHQVTVPTKQVEDKFAYRFLENVPENFAIFNQLFVHTLIFL